MSMTNQKTSGVYKIINKVDGKYYIGSSGDIRGFNRGRWYGHINKLKKNKHINSHLQNAWNKYKQKKYV
jgi:hypothetical protein